MLRLIFDYYLTDSFDAETLLVLVNAIYFKSDWDVKFRERATIDCPFWVSHSQQIYVKMMWTTKICRWKKHLKDLEAGLLALDYKGSRMCFVILLPDANDGLSNLEKKLESVDLGELDRDAVSTKVKLYLPKFKLEESVNLNSVLQNVNID
ncbi:Antichymotrypsin-2 [Armadillidium vulgare]|nr:Antichymotrypsin-2 [Armadillidium vulgare]